MTFDLPRLPDNWHFAPLASCSRPGSITYGIVQPGAALPIGVPIIRVNNFRETRLDLTDIMRVAPDIAAQYERTRLRGGEVLLTVVGTVGQVAVVPPELAGLNVARAVAVIHPLPHVGAEWIALCLRSPLSQHLLTSRANTTVQTTINLKDLRALPIPLPPAQERKAITAVVGALDDRIALLRETNATLEAIAQALFKSWFVDFDPVRAKMEGREPQGMDEATAALFPDGFEESSFGLVPKGWENTTVAQSFILTMGQSPPGDTYNQTGQGLPLYQGRTDFGFRFPTQRVFCTSPSRIAEIGDTLVSVRAPVGDVNMAIERCAVGRGVASVRHPRGYNGFTFYAMRGLREKFDTFDSEGTVFGSINKKDFEALSIVSPPISVLAAYDTVSSFIDSRIVAGEEQIRTLTALRDALLPRLISGQLRIGQAAEALEPA